MKPDMPNLPIPSEMMKSLGDIGSPPVFGDKGPTKPKAKSQVASFLGGAMLPAREGMAGKTLTGQ